MSDYRVRLAVDFAERIARMGVPATSACELSAKTYAMDPAALQIEWLRRLLAVATLASAK